MELKLKFQKFSLILMNWKKPMKNILMIMEQKKF